MLAKQHYIENKKLLLYASIAYIGIIFLFLSIVQISKDREPHSLEAFRGFIIVFVAVFGILYTGYSFPAFRNKETTITYLMLPSSILEKFLFEFITRLSIVVILLPGLFWLTFHFQGYFFNLFTVEPFESFGFAQVLEVGLPNEIQVYELESWFRTMIIAFVMLGFVFPFTGGAMFSKQPLVKTLFSVALIMIFYVACAYVIVEPLGIGKYQPNESMWLIPNSKKGVIQFFGTLAILGNLVMLFVAYRKLKEREV